MNAVAYAHMFMMRCGRDGLVCRCEAIVVKKGWLVQILHEPKYAFLAEWFFRYNRVNRS